MTERAAWEAALRRALDVQDAVLHDEALWQAHCEQEQDAAMAFMRSRIEAGRAPLATAAAMVSIAAAQWAAACSSTGQQKAGGAMLRRMLEDGLTHGQQFGKSRDA